MPATKQSQAVQVWNSALSIGGLVQTLGDAVNAFMFQYVNDGASATWAAFATTALNADGSPGAADGSPNTAHPVDASKVPGLNRAAAQADMLTLVSNLQTLQQFLHGTGVGTVSLTINRRAALDPLVGG